MKSARFFLLAACLPAMAWAQETTVKETDKNFFAAKAEDRWIYNDLDKGMSLAKAQSKPLMVVFRCIP